MRIASGPPRTAALLAFVASLATIAPAQQEPKPAAKPAVPSIPAVPILPATPPPAADPAAVQGEDAAAQVKKLRAEFDAAMAAFMAKYKAAKSDEEKQKLFESDYPKADAFAPKFMAIADGARGSAAALDCYTWVAGQSGDPKIMADLLARVRADHLTQPGLAAFLPLLARTVGDPSAEAFLREAIETSPHLDVRGQATWTLASLLKQTASLLGRLSSMAAEEREGLVGYLGGAERVKALEARGAEKIQAECEALLEKVASDFAAVKSRRGTLGEAAASALFEMRNLAIGKVAPEVEGKDVDGNDFKLSDYRGKVVVIDFWGFW